MALQTLSSSATAAEGTSTGTSNSGFSDSELNGRNSIPFSFLVAFLALFVAFMTIGLCARRIVYYVRLQLGLPVPLPPQRMQVVKPKKPELWDVYPERGIDSGRWANMEVSSGISSLPPPFLTLFVAPASSRCRGGSCGKQIPP